LPAASLYIFEATLSAAGIVKSLSCAFLIGVWDVECRVSVSTEAAPMRACRASSCLDSNHGHGGARNGNADDSPAAVAQWKKRHTHTHLYACIRIYWRWLVIPPGAHV